MSRRFRNKGDRYQRFTRLVHPIPSFAEGESSYRHQDQDGGERGRRNGRPPGLRGRAIGMYYKNLNKSKSTEERFKNKAGRPMDFHISNRRVCEIKKLMEQCSSTPYCAPVEDRESYSNIAESDFKTQFLSIINYSIHDRLNSSYTKIKDRVESLDDEYFKDLEYKKMHNKTYEDMMESRMKLPSYDKRDEILKIVEANQVVLISGETGCGKTTQVAQFILDEYINSKKGSICKIVCTQPRRISAISIAERVAKERGERCGLSVGYQIRLEKVLPRPTGSILFCTTGVILKLMESDPFLSEISHLILDEIHERDIISDFLITLLKQVTSIRKDLKLILMSATMNSEKFSKYYNDCVHVNIPGLTYPVKQYYLEDVLLKTRFEFPKTSLRPNWSKKSQKKEEKKDNSFAEFIEPYVRDLNSRNLYPKRVIEGLRNRNSEVLNLDLILDLIKYICVHEDQGAILVFLPGFADISKMHQLLVKDKMFNPSNSLIIPLHSKMPSTEQKSIFHDPPDGVRKIVIATNIAETSITINDVVYVIDSGVIKMKDYDVESNIESLQVEWISIANADQRKGRAGRVKPGKCYHLYTKARKMTFKKFTVPEILRTRLDNVILSLKILQLGNAASFLNRVMDPPSELAIERSISVLTRMNALDKEERLTPLGYHLAKLPMGPQVGKMALLGALFSCLNPVLSIAASLDFKDAFMMPVGKESLVDKKKKELLPYGWKSDHLVLYEALDRYERAKSEGWAREFCWEFFLSSHTLELLENMKGQFAEYLCELNFLSDPYIKDAKWNINSQNFSLIKAIICAGLYPNVAIIKKVRNQMRTIKTIENEKINIHPSSVNAFEKHFESCLLVYHLKLKSSKLYMFDTTMVHVLPLLFFGDEFEIDKTETETIITLTKALRFKCPENTAHMIMDLRSRLNNLLEYKVSHPGVVNWTEDNAVVTLLRAVMELITVEETGDVEFLSSDEEF